MLRHNLKCTSNICCNFQQLGDIMHNTLRLNRGDGEIIARVLLFTIDREMANEFQ